jgi:hypothetical protein
MNTIPIPPGKKRLIAIMAKGTNWDGILMNM